MTCGKTSLISQECNQIARILGRMCVSVDTFGLPSVVAVCALVIVEEIATGLVTLGGAVASGKS